MTAIQDLWQPLRFQRKLSSALRDPSLPGGPVSLVVELRRLECLFRAEAAQAGDATLKLALTRARDDLCLLVEQFSADIAGNVAHIGECSIVEPFPTGTP